MNTHTRILAGVTAIVLSPVAVTLSFVLHGWSGITLLWTLLR